MSTLIHAKEDHVLYAVHPLDDVPEEKRSADGLGQIKMSKSVRASLIALRVYLFGILTLALFRVVGLLGLFSHHIVK